MARRSDLAAVAPRQLKDVVYEQLRNALIDLTFRPDEPLREAALVDQLGVSKTPIREALVRLEREGLVELAPYRGARARSYSADDLRELFEARELIECECVRRVARAAEPRVVDELSQNVDDARSALRRGESRLVANLLDEFDDLLYAQIDNHLLDELLDRLRAHFRRIGRLDASPARYSASVSEHAEIVTAIREGQPEEAERLLCAHLHRLLDERLSTLGQDIEPPPRPRPRPRKARARR